MFQGFFLRISRVDVVPQNCGVGEISSSARVAICPRPVVSEHGCHARQQRRGHVGNG
jgi:hypothetical protein